MIGPLAPRDGFPRYPSLWDGCVAAMCPSLGCTSNKLVDFSGRRNDGTLTNFNVATGWTTNFHNSLWFANLSTNVVALPLISGLSTEGAVSLWFRRNAVTSINLDYLLWSMVTSGTDRIFLEFETFAGAEAWNPNNGNTTPQVVLNWGASNPGFGGVITVGKWHHVCASWVVGKTVSPTLDGAPGFPAAGTYTAQTNVASKLGNYTTLSLSPGCSIDDFRLYDRALSPSEELLLAKRRGIAYEMDRYVGRSSSTNRRRRALIAGV